MEEPDKRLLDNRLITSVLFYPLRIDESDVPALSHGKILRARAGSASLGAYLYRPLPGAPTVLFFHGNGEIMTDYLYGYQALLENIGLNFLVVDYRGYGLSDGSPTLSGLLEDARAGWDLAAGELGLKPDEIIVMGRSLGSLAALEIVSGPGSAARALVIESGIAGLDGWVERMGPMIESMGLNLTALQSALRRHFNHEQKIKSFPGPVLIMHTRNDEIVPSENARQLATWSAPRSTLKIFEQGGHNDIQLLNQQSYFQTLASFIKNSQKK